MHATSFGCGVFIQSVGWFSIPWPAQHEPVSIFLLKLIPVILATAIWGSYWTGQHVCFHSDNTGVAIMHSRDQLSNALNCYDVSLCTVLSLTFCTLPSTYQDALSHNDLLLFSSLIPQTPQSFIPSATFNLLVSSHHLGAHQTGQCSSETL